MENTETGWITLLVNGESRSVPEGSTLADLLAGLELLTEHVAVEHNREIVPRARLAGTSVHAGDRIEIVQFVGGG